MTHVHHHQIKRKKKKSKKIKNEKYIYLLDKLVLIIGLVVPFLTFLQAYKIWSTQSADGISLVTYSGYIVTNIIWLLYGLAHQEKPLIIMYVLLAICNASIVVGAFLY